MEEWKLKKFLITNFLTLDVIIILQLLIFFIFDWTYFYGDDFEKSRNDLNEKERVLDHFLGMAIWGSYIFTYFPIFLIELHEKIEKKRNLLFYISFTVERSFTSLLFLYLP